MPIAPEILEMAAEITKESIRASGRGYVEEPEKVSAFLEAIVQTLDELRWRPSKQGA